MKETTILANVVIVGAVLFVTLWICIRRPRGADDSQAWFSKNAAELSRLIDAGDDAGLDRLLHRASQWHYMNASQWTAFAAHHVRMLLGQTTAAVDNRTLDVLELGCGSGGWIRSARRHWLPNARFTGVDLNLESVSIARRVVAAGAAFLIGDLRDMRYLQNASFDAVVAPGSIGYVRNLVDVRASLEEVARVLRPGGVFMASVFGLPGSEKKLGSFRITAPRSWWQEAVPALAGWKFEDMTAWPGCNCERRQRYRYAVSAVRQ
jgi:ubiquinone/menaquinone biosynthesis C-methylase UbiE